MVRELMLGEVFMSFVCTCDSVYVHMNVFWISVIYSLV